MKTVAYFILAAGMLCLGACSRSSGTADQAAQGGPSGTTAASPDEVVVDDGSPGLAVGETAPTFQLKDQDGQERSLESLLASGPVALVFYRSADW